nr:E3 ubiquitin-protein ligase RNF14 isoform X3 [Oryza sativa Japonica Group]
MSSEASSSSSAAVAVRDLGDDNPSASPEVDTTYWAAQEEATALLESMAARVRGEEELSEEQMQANDQLQEDEVIALEAIFGGDMVILENKDSLRFIQIFVHYSLPDGIRVFLNLRRSGALVGTGDNENHNGGEVCYACRLQHLPPVVLTCLLPRSYPSTCAPYFTISAKWLDEPKVSYLCAAFDEIWTELPGQEVIYRWWIG